MIDYEGHHLVKPLDATQSANHFRKVNPNEYHFVFVAGRLQSKFFSVFILCGMDTMNNATVTNTPTANRSALKSRAFGLHSGEASVKPPNQAQMP